jgi:hypothetical protein
MGETSIPHICRKRSFQLQGCIEWLEERRPSDAGGKEKEALSRLEAQDTIQAMQIRMNLQQLFTMDAKTARRFLDRWRRLVQVCDLGR